MNVLVDFLIFNWLLFIYSFPFRSGFSAAVFLHCDWLFSFTFTFSRKGQVEAPSQMSGSEVISFKRDCLDTHIVPTKWSTWTTKMVSKCELNSLLPLEIVM